MNLSYQPLRTTQEIADLIKSEQELRALIEGTSWDEVTTVVLATKGERADECDGFCFPPAVAAVAPAIRGALVNLHMDAAAALRHHNIITVPLAVEKS